MRVLRRIQQGAEYRSSGLANPQAWLLNALTEGATSWSGMTVTPEKVLQLPAARGAVSLISNAISLCPLKVYRDEDDGTQSAAEGHRAWPMLHDKPNEHMPADSYWKLVTRQLVRHGNSFHEKRRNMLTGLVDELRPLPPTKTSVRWNHQTWEKTYVVDDEYGRREYGSSDVLHFLGDTDDGLIGRSPFTDCKEAFGNALSRQEFEASFWRRAAVFAGVIEHPGRLGTESAIDRLKRAFSSKYEGSKKSFGTSVLEEGAHLVVPAAPLAGLQFNESEQRTRTEIAVIFNIPPAFLAGSTGDSLTYATIESNQIQFAQLAVAPWANLIAKTISADASIFPFSSWYAEFVLEGLMRGDAASRAAVYSQLFGLVDEDGRRALEVNEIRALENRRPATKRPAQPAPPVVDTAQPPVAQPTAQQALNVARLRG